MCHGLDNAKNCNRGLFRTCDLSARLLALLRHGWVTVSFASVS